MVTALKECTFVTQILKDLHQVLDGKVPCFTDSRSGFDIMHNPGVTRHSAHFGRWLHWAREKVLNGEVELIFCTTDKMMADALSKPVERSIFFRCMSFILNVDFDAYLKEVNLPILKQR